jgi:pimeloyl-ACP methyl ester carboxylesterase
MPPGVRAAILLLVPALACNDSTAPVPLGWSEVRTYSTHSEVDLGWRSSDGAVLSGTLYLPPEPGPHPGLVIHMGSNRWRRLQQPSVAGWLYYGVAVFSYDKRGVGRSQGSCCPYSRPGYFPLLADDVLSAVRQLQLYPDIRPDLVGAWGFSQGGWVVPVAAVKGGGDIAFTWVGSGPAVSLGEELLYSALTGEGDCHPTGRSPADIESTLEQAGPSGFDPRPWLGQQTVPGLWIYGELDLSVPVTRSIRVLDSIQAIAGHDFTDTVIAGINHSWIENGGICQYTGQSWIDGPVTVPWLDARFPGWRIR